jgi:integrase
LLGKDVTLRQVADAYLAQRRLDLPPQDRQDPRKNMTYRNDEDRLNLIVSSLPVEKVRDLLKGHCHQFVRRMMSEACKNNPLKKRSRSTAVKPVRVLIAALRFAAQRDLCSNPLGGIELGEASGDELRKRRRAMTADEYDRFLKAAVARDLRLARDNPDRVPQAPALLAVYESGRRAREIRLLEWPSVHIGTSPTWEFHDTKGMKIGKARQDQPERYAIPPRVVPYLHALKGLHQRMLGRQVGRGDRVFLSPEGLPLHPENFRDEFYLVLEDAGIERVDHRGRSLDLHAARTTIYARGAELGIPVDQMMVFVGHRDIRTAMRHYHDPNATSTRRIAEALAKLGRKRPEEQAGNETPAATTQAPATAPQPAPQPASPVVPQPAPEPAKPAAEANPPGRRRIPALPPRRRAGAGWRGRGSVKAGR